MAENEQANETQGNGADYGLTFEDVLKQKPWDWIAADFQKAHQEMMAAVRKGEKTPQQATQELASFRKRLLAARPELTAALRDVPQAEFDALPVWNSTEAGQRLNGTPLGAPITSTTAPAASVQPAAAPGANNNGGGGGTALKSLVDLIGTPVAGAIPNFSGWSDQDLKRFMPIAGDPDSGISADTGRNIATNNFLRAAGYNPDVGNPWLGSAQGMVEPMLGLSQNYRTVTGQGASTRDTLNDVAGVFGGGRADYFDQTSGRAYLAAMSAMLDKPDTERTAGQKLLASKWNDPKNTESAAADLYQNYFDANTAGLAPQLRNNSGLRRRAFDQSYEKWLNMGQAAPRYDRYLWGNQ